VSCVFSPFFGQKFALGQNKLTHFAGIYYNFFALGQKFLAYNNTTILVVNLPWGK
jgi:hypothetical protein